MWTNENRARYDRSGLRYPSDLTDEEWALIAPLIPPAKRGGGKHSVDLRAVVNGLMYVLSRGCQWRAIPKDLPARSTVHDDLDLWDYDGTLARIHHTLYVACREQAGRDASPTHLRKNLMQSQKSVAADNVSDTTLKGSHVRWLRVLRPVAKVEGLVDVGTPLVSRGKTVAAVEPRMGSVRRP